MDYKYIHKNLGSVLFRNGQDMLVNLCWVLVRAENNAVIGSASCTSLTNNTDAAGILIEVGGLM